jgi:serine/threonine protein kinase
MEELSEKVNFIHKHRIVHHRDLKTANLLINDDEELKIGDF